MRVLVAVEGRNEGEPRARPRLAQGVPKDEPGALQGRQDGLEVDVIVGQDRQLQHPRLPFETAFPIRHAPEAGKRQSEREPSAPLRFVEPLVGEEFGPDDARPRHYAALPFWVTVGAGRAFVAVVLTCGTPGWHECAGALAGGQGAPQLGQNSQRIRRTG